jgi:hypothetical protein
MRVILLILRMRFWLLLLSLLLAIPAPAATKYKVLYNFHGGNDAGGPLYGALALDKNGNLFGTAGGGGKNDKCGGSCGTVFELAPHANGKWSETVIFRFQSSGTGFWPFGGVIVDNSGNLYGTTASGGAHYNNGNAFVLQPNASGWIESVLYNFGGRYGSPQSGLVRDAKNLYGAADSLYELSPKDGGRWTERMLYQFHPQHGKDGTDGDGSGVPLVLDGMGNLYGATSGGGNYSQCKVFSDGCGTVFELLSEGGGKWKEHVLYRFAQSSDDGQRPMAGVVRDAHGNLYGTTSQGGKYQNGTIYELIRDKAGHWQEKILYSFRDVADGGMPGPVIFKLAPVANGKWKYTVLHHFNGADGGQPWAGLTFGRKGEIYGTTSWGGEYLYGVAFELSP